MLRSTSCSSGGDSISDVVADTIKEGTKRKKTFEIMLQMQALTCASFVMIFKSWPFTFCLGLNHICGNDIYMAIAASPMRHQGSSLNITRKRASGSNFP